MNYMGPHTAFVLTRRLDEKDVEIAFLEEQRDFLSARLQIIADLYPSEEDEATDIAYKALVASGKMETEFSQKQAREWAERDVANSLTDHAYFGGTQ